MIEVDGKPTKKQREETQFSTIKKIRGRRASVPFLGLESGEHVVRFKHGKTHTDCVIKVWLSMYGWAWIILRDA